MSETDKWLIDYGETHADVENAGLYWLAVPLLVVGTVGLLWSLPIPEAFCNISPLLNWGSAFLMAAVVYYFIISVSLAIGMLPFLFGVAALASWLSVSQYPLIWVSAGLVGGAVIGALAWPTHERRNQGCLAGCPANDDRSRLVVVGSLPAFGNTLLKNPLESWVALIDTCIGET